MYTTGTIVKIVDAFDGSWIGKEGKIIRSTFRRGEPVYYTLDIGGGHWLHSMLEKVEVKNIPTKNINFEEEMEVIPFDKYKAIGEKIGTLVDEKNRAYGDSFNKAGDFLKILYPNGVRPEQYKDVLGLVRVFDKQMRIATDKDALGENPWNDITGYGILMSEER